MIKQINDKTFVKININEIKLNGSSALSYDYDRDLSIYYAICEKEKTHIVANALK